MLANGVTAIRTHADLTPTNGLHVGAGVDRRARAPARAGRHPGRARCRAGRRSASRAPTSARSSATPSTTGVDVVGGCPHLETDPAAANDGFLTIAARSRPAARPAHRRDARPGDAGASSDLADRVIATGFPHGVTASHCVSLGVQTEHRQREVAEKVAAAGHQRDRAPPHQPVPAGSRASRSAMPRALTAVKALREPPASTWPPAPTTCRIRSTRWAAAIRWRPPA